jgi:hypothetical protein
LPLYCLPNLYALVVTNFYTTNDVREKATFWPNEPHEFH